MITDLSPEEYEKLNMPRVRIHARIVPNGAAKRPSSDDSCPVDECNDTKLRATLLLTPYFDEANSADGVAFDRWPEEIHALLTGPIKGLIATVPKGIGSGSVCDGFQQEVTFAAPGLAGLSDEDLETLCDTWVGSIWKYDLADKDGIIKGAKIEASDWGDLGTRIKRSLDGGAVSSSSMGSGDGKSTPPEASLYGPDGQVAPTEEAGRAKMNVVAALDIRHADLAITLENQRASALSDSIKAACKEEVARLPKPLKRRTSEESDKVLKNDKLRHVAVDSPLRDLAEAILKEPLRGAEESFDSYAQRLSILFPKEPHEDTTTYPLGKRKYEVKEVKEALLSDVDLIAELRRRRRIAERTALFDDLVDDRKTSVAHYKKAKGDLQGKALEECVRPSDPEWQDSVTPGDAANGDDRFDDLTAAARYANWQQYRTKEDEEEQKNVTPETSDSLDAAQRSFFTLQSTPTLARAAMLAVDLELDLTVNENAAALNEAGDYAHICVDLNGTSGGRSIEADLPRPWTLLRVTEHERNKSCYHFWPVSREEADCRGGASSAPAKDRTRHYGGLMVMGFGSDCDLTCKTPRFDLTSLDIRTAMELEIQRRSIEQSNSEAKEEVESQEGKNAREKTPGAAATDTKALPPGVNQPTDGTELQDEGDRQDVGLTLLDRGLCAQAIRKMAARDAKLADKGRIATCSVDGRASIVLDGEDLTTGYRFFIGTPGNACTKWHPMMSRAIEFGTTGPRWRKTGRIERVLTRLIGRTGSSERVALESAAMNVPGRMLPKAPAPNSDDVLEAEAVFEQAVSVWDGGPMGVECSTQPGAEKTTADVLIFGRELSIPDGVDYQIPRLRYGQPYRFALAAVFSGGRSLDGTDFPDDTGKTDTRADLYFPSARMQAASQDRVDEDGASVGTSVRPYVRALRQAKIGAPQVLLPEGHAVRTNGPMGPDQAGLMLVRSIDRNEKNPKDKRFTSRGQPASARRIILIPSIPFARASTHMGTPDGKAGPSLQPEDPTRGVFDDLARTPTSTGGLTFVRQQKGGCGFPSVKTTYLKGLNGGQHFARRSIEDAPSDKSLLEGEDLDGSVFAAGSSSDSAYYPDPAAEALVVRVRMQGGEGEWLTMVQDDKPEQGDIAPIDLVEGHTYPDRRRVLLTLNRDKIREEVPTKLGQIMQYNPRRYFDPAHQGSAEASGKFLARELILKLAPHEWVDIEMWLLPSAKRLAQDFAVIQALGVQLSQVGETSVASSLRAICKGANMCLPQAVFDKIIADLQNSDQGKQAFFAPGGVSAPSMQTLLALAKAVRQCMIRHPMPEISAVSQLRAIHAANRATIEPFIAGAETNEHFDGVAFSSKAPGVTEPPKPIRAFRPSEIAAGPKTFDAVVAEREVANRENPNQSSKDKKSLKVCIDDETTITVAAKGSTNLILDGEVQLDLNQIDTVEVRARMAFPGSTAFDDRLRGRSLALRRAGWWPLVDDPSGAEPDSEDKVFRDAQSLFGFHVYPSGKTAFDRAEVTLLRAENLPRPSGADCQRKLSLRRLFEEGDLGDIRITERHLFPDGKARRMWVWVNGLPRTAQFMRTADRRLRRRDPWVASEGLHHEVGDLVAGEDLRAEAQCRLSGEVEVVLPATKRPAKPDARAPLPAFRHDAPDEDSKKSKMLTHHRRSIIRIPLGREWFSSGEDERLGIVLWPPYVSPSDNWMIGKNKVKLRKSEDDKDAREIDLNDLKEFRLTKRKLVDIICAPLSGSVADDPMPFEDAHLGPGGRFVSRRGADPVREGNYHRQILFSPGDFPDLDLKEGDPQKAELVPMVEMPLSDEEASEDADAEDRVPPMMVSLLTYVPRFDPEKETWYVDVTLEDSEAAETFVRFGLVRFQPHTRPALRCSRPVRQFVQPLPERIVDVTRIPENEGDGIRIRMCGPTFYRRRISHALQEHLSSLSKAADGADAAIPPGAGAPIADGAEEEMKTPTELALERGCRLEDLADLVQGADAAPRMKVTVFREGKDAHGRTYRETVPLPVSAAGRGSHLLLPLDFDTGVIDPKDFSSIRRNDPESRRAFLRLNESHPIKAGSVAVKTAQTARGDGTWLLKIPKEVLGDLNDLHVQVEEVEAFEPADPLTVEERARVPEPSMVMEKPDNRTVDAAAGNGEANTVTATSVRAPASAGGPNARELGYHHSGARMRAVFDLSKLD
ncbi:hypothetical protein [Ruegeria halocynthiae]|uniref:hypothetical protein n=1 Tax=Ruegeria halocynthiae TaxID=985054 RepID=UPI000564C963|nr:hypothetical protein [Ruegeria halocynthiae]